MILEVSWDGLWTLSFGLSQSHGHGSWLVCEVALIGLISSNVRGGDPTTLFANPPFFNSALEEPRANNHLRRDEVGDTAAM
jgi:hypothetical protein